MTLAGFKELRPPLRMLTGFFKDPLKAPLNSDVLGGVSFVPVPEKLMVLPLLLRDFMMVRVGAFVGVIESVPTYGIRVVRALGRQRSGIGDAACHQRLGDNIWISCDSTQQQSCFRMFPPLVLPHASCLRAMRCATRTGTMCTVLDRILPYSTRRNYEWRRVNFRRTQGVALPYPAWYSMS